MIQKCIVYILIIFMGYSGDFFAVYCNHWRQLLTYRKLKKKPNRTFTLLVTWPQACTSNLINEV